MQSELIEKLEDVVDLIDHAVSNPDIELSYCIPDVAMTADNANVSGDPYIHLKYMSNGTHTMEQNIPIKKNYLKKTPEDIANLVTFYIEQFVEQIDSVEYGAQ
ncbi:MAG: hypothetical protein KAH72_08195 [Flavobacteriaceae bacterium]|nr:hypothetical protein [Flavobacteriaceae bacterium]